MATEQVAHAPRTEPTDESSDAAIVVKGLTKEFDGLVAVDGLSFEVRRGEVFGFLGPNGSGKTAAMKAMLGLVRPDTGVVRIGGADVQTAPKAAKAGVGFLPERLSFYDNLTPVQTLSFFAQLKGVPVDAHALLREVGLDHAADRRVGTFSKGMAQLLGIAQAMIGDPSIYVLAKSMSRLDPWWTRCVREKTRVLNEAGATVFLSSHNLGEVPALCDRVDIIDRGRPAASTSRSRPSPSSSWDQ